MKNIIWFIHKYIYKLSEETLAKFDIFTNL